MLDFTALQQQLNDMVLNQQSARRSFSQKLQIAQGELTRWADEWPALRRKAEESRTSWLLAADIQESFIKRYSAPACPQRMTVVATDGSQIFPDRHELSDCYLINIGTVVLHYGTGERPVLTNRPRLFYGEHELADEWNGKRMPVTEDVVNARRGVLEIQELAAQAELSAQQQRTVAALTDGTLILWSLAGKPRQFQQEILRAYFDTFDLLESYQIPLAGYISRPGSNDVINLLRLGLCPENPTNCDQCPFKGQPPELPCEPIEGISDADLFERILQKGERSPVFKSQSGILDHYGKHVIYFFYVHVGVEIARVEIPKWIAYEPALVEFVHATVCDQAQKGQGYPISLAEAHEQAVVKSTEREQFYRQLEGLYVRQGLEVSFSRKFMRKRHASI